MPWRALFSGATVDVVTAKRKDGSEVTRAKVLREGQEVDEIASYMVDAFKAGDERITSMLEYGTYEEAEVEDADGNKTTKQVFVSSSDKEAIRGGSDVETVEVEVEVVDYSVLSEAALKAEVKARKLDVQGTGPNGAAQESDLVKALQEDDRQNSTAGGPLPS